MKLRAYLTPANVMVYTFMPVVQFAAGCGAALGLEPSAPFNLLHALGYVYVLGYWLLHDSRRHELSGICDLGLWLLLAWPLLLPYHLFKTRGVRALIPILLFCAVFCLAYLLGVSVGALYAA